MCRCIRCSLWRLTSLSLLDCFRCVRVGSGSRVDAEVASRPASKLLGRFLRHYIMWVLGPWERALVRWRVTPNALTFSSFVVACLSAVFFAVGNFGAGGWLYLLTGILDILDGRIARATGKVTKGGAFFDSVMDRYAELVVFGGLTIFYRHNWALYVALVASLGSIMVSYTRARGEALGAIRRVEETSRAPVLADPLELVIHQVDDLGGLGRRAARVQPDVAGVGVAGVERVHRVRQAPLSRPPGTTGCSSRPRGRR